MMWFVCLHSDESVEIRSAQEVEERAFYAICEIVSENDFFYSEFFCVFFEFSVPPFSEFCFCFFSSFFSFYDDELCSFKKFFYKNFILCIPRSGSMVTMNKKQVVFIIFFLYKKIV